MSAFTDFLAFELHLETAAATVLKTSGFNVHSPFVPLIAGNPTALPDDCCWVTYEAGDSDDQARAFLADSAGDLTSIAAAYEGTLEIHHRVPVGDQPAAPGAEPACYRRLLQQRGRIRALFLDHDTPLRALLPLHDILSIRLIQPDRSTDRERSANQAVERFRLRLMPSEAATGTE